MADLATMSQQREAIALALTMTLPDGTELQGHEAAPSVIAQWQAWPVWDSSTWANPCVPEHTWRVYVCLPDADAQSASDAVGEVLEAVAMALWRLGSIDRAQPVVWATDGMQGYACIQWTITI